MVCSITDVNFPPCVRIKASKIKNLFNHTHILNTPPSKKIHNGIWFKRMKHVWIFYWIFSSSDHIFRKFTVQFTFMPTGEWILVFLVSQFPLIFLFIFLPLINLQYHKIYFMFPKWLFPMWSCLLVPQYIFTLEQRIVTLCICMVSTEKSLIMILWCFLIASNSHLKTI